MIYQEWRTKNDRNGNPRRITVVWHPDGELSNVIEHGYGGCPYREEKSQKGNADLGFVFVPPAEYRDMVKTATDSGFMSYDR